MYVHVRSEQLQEINYFLVQPFSYNSASLLVLSNIGHLPVWGVFLAGVFGLMLSLLFFMDQNVSSALANSKDIHILI